VGNRQIGVSLTIATKHEHDPIDFAVFCSLSLFDPAAAALGQTKKECTATVPDLAAVLRGGGSSLQVDLPRRSGRRPGVALIRAAHLSDRAHRKPTVA